MTGHGDGSRPASSTQAAGQTDGQQDRAGVPEQIGQDGRDAREDSRSTALELHASAEQKGPDGEALAINEELQAANAELASSKAMNRRLEEMVAARTNALLESQESMRACWDANPDGVFILDGSLRLADFNPSASRLFGYAEEMLRETTFRELFERACFDGSEVAELLRTDLHSENRWPKEMLARRRDGGQFPVTLFIRRVDHRDRFVAVVRDISNERRLQEEVVRAATEEQVRIGFELHDGTQQELMGLGQLTETLIDRLREGDLAQALQIASRVAEGIAEAGQHVRALARGMMPVAVDAAGLRKAIECLARWTEETSGLACRTVLPDELPVRDDTVALHLYSIIRESLSNAVKHANARALAIRIALAAGDLLVSVEDDGDGIPEGAIPTANGLGLRIMRHRCSLLGGRFHLGPGADGGTVVSCRIPMGAGGKQTAAP